MKVINKKANKIRRKDFYTIKTCSCCNQQIELNNGDILDATDEGNNHVSIICPECGSKVILRRYICGKQYTPNQYLVAVAGVKSDIWNILAEIGEIDRGYGEEYFNVSMLWVTVNPIRIEFTVFINEYEYGNWEHAIAYSKRYKSMTVDITDYFCLDSVDEYAAYAQAIKDYILEKLDHPVPNGYKIKDVVLFEKELLNWFRDGDCKIDLSVLSCDKHSAVKQQNYRDAHTLFFPETDKELHYIGHSIEDGLDKVATAVCLAGIGAGSENNVTVVNRYYGW